MQVNRPGAGESTPDEPPRTPVPPKADVNRPVLITDAPTNLDDEWTHRRNRYVVMMLLRALCVIGAALTYTISGWLAAVFVAGGVVLPWTAVVMANDRMPKEGVRFRRFFGGTPNGASKVGRPRTPELDSAPQTQFDPADPSDGGDHPVIEI